MKQILFSLSFCFLLLFFSNIETKAQSFNFVKATDYNKIGMLIDTVSNMIPKVIFIEDDPVLLYNKGLPAEDVKIKTGNIASLQGFSDVSYEFNYKKIKYNLPYLKIRYEDASYWVNGLFPYIFDDAHPDIIFTSNDVKYNVYSTKCVRYSGEEIYEGIKPIVIKNTKENTYKLITSNSFPTALKGHSYGCRFAYLQNDFGVNEKVVGAKVENNIVILDINASYQEGSATYQISFNLSDSQFVAKYGKIIYQ